MPRGPRNDSPGRIFHVTNRGTARRTMFERPSDFRYFLSRLARSVRRGEIDVLAYSILATHFHLVVRSHGKLSEAMRRIQGEYARHFNRSRRRDGPLQRGRFRSKHVDSNLYLVNLIPYVDDNPVLARLVREPGQWQWGSAWARRHSRHGQWLSTDLANFSRPGPTTGARAARVGFIEARLEGSGGPSPYESMVDVAPERVAAWMRRKAKLADGTAPGLPIAGPMTVIEAIEREPSGCAEATIKVPGGKRHRMKHLLLAGMLRELAGLSHAAVARTLVTSDARAKRLHEHHERCIRDSADYRLHAASAVKYCLDLLTTPRNRRTLA